VSVCVVIVAVFSHQFFFCDPDDSLPSTVSTGWFETALVQHHKRKCTVTISCVRLIVLFVSFSKKCNSVGRCSVSVCLAT